MTKETAVKLLSISRYAANGMKKSKNGILPLWMWLMF